MCFASRTPELTVTRVFFAVYTEPSEQRIVTLPDCDCFSIEVTILLSLIFEMNG